jgi:hypothetical protein
MNPKILSDEKKLEKCPNCGEKLSIQTQEQHPIFKKMETILRGKKTAHEKKIALFKCLKDLDVGELQPIENKRLDSLLLSKLYNELAKQAMKEYEKSEKKTLIKW